MQMTFVYPHTLQLSQQSRLTFAYPVGFVNSLFTMGQSADRLRNADNAECLLTEIFKYVCMREKVFFISRTLG